MAAPLLLLDALFGATSAALFGYVGVLNRRRSVRDGEARLAVRAFTAWWFGFALLTLTNAARSLVAGLGNAEVPVHVALETARNVLLAVALWGLTTYLVFIYRGRHAWQPAIRAYFAALPLLLAAVMWWTQPTSVETEGWNAGLVMARPLDGLPLLAVLLAILGPPPALAVAYALLYRRAEDPATRRRILLVGGALALWFGLSILANATSIVRIAWWPLAARALAVGATLVLVYAYLPVLRRAPPAGATGG